jgi:hypothetical protein
MKRPVAIIDESGNYAVPSELITNPLVQIFRIAGISAGKQAARLLLELGHTSVAFLSPFHSTCWSQQRQRGLDEQYAKAGYSRGVHHMTNKELVGVELLLMKIMSDTGFDESQLRNIFSIDRTESQVEDLFRRFHEARNKTEYFPFTYAESQSLRSNLSCFCDVV